MRKESNGGEKRREAKIYDRERFGDDGAARTPLLDWGYLARALTRIGAAAMAVCMVFYFAYHLYARFTPKVTTTLAVAAEKKVFASATAYTLREETPLTSAYADYYIDPLFDDGERVAKGEAVANAYAGGDRADVKKRLDDIDREIRIVEYALAGDAEYSGAQAVSARAAEDYRYLMSALCTGDVAAAAATSETWRKMMGRAAVLNGDVETYSARLKELKSERQAELARLGKSAAVICAESAGYYYSECDGYEGTFGKDLISDFSVSAFAEARASEPSDAAGSAGKIANASEWYIAFEAPYEDFADLRIGSSYEVRFTDNGGISCRMKLEKRLYSDGGNAVLLFSSNLMPEGMLYLRCQRIEVESAEYAGYRVPVSALRFYDGETGVFTLHGGYVLFRRVDVLWESDGYCIVASYEASEKGAPLTYWALGYDSDGHVGEYEGIHSFAEEKGWQKTERDNGGVPLKSNETYLYYYHLSASEDVILTGKDLYHGKVLG